MLSRTANLACGSLMMDLDTAGEHIFKLRARLRQRTWRHWGDGLNFDILIPFMQTTKRPYSFRRRKLPADFSSMLNTFRDLDYMIPRNKVFALLATSNDKDRIAGIDHPLCLCRGRLQDNDSDSAQEDEEHLSFGENGREWEKNIPPSWLPDLSASIGRKQYFHNDLCFLMSWELFGASSGPEADVDFPPRTST